MLGVLKFVFIKTREGLQKYFVGTLWEILDWCQDSRVNRTQERRNDSDSISIVWGPPFGYSVKGDSILPTAEDQFGRRGSNKRLSIKEELDLIPPSWLQGNKGHNPPVSGCIYRSLRRREWIYWEYMGIRTPTSREQDRPGTSKSLLIRFVINFLDNPGILSPPGIVSAMPKLDLIGLLAPKFFYHQPDLRDPCIDKGVSRLSQPGIITWGHSGLMRK